MTTREKMLEVVRAIRAVDPKDAPGDTRGLVEALQMAQAFGFDPAAYLIPDTDAEADLFVDKAIDLLLRLRGDDLPPFDLSRYGEAVAE